VWILSGQTIGGIAWIDCRLWIRAGPPEIDFFYCLAGIVRGAGALAKSSDAA
jgi:hypothetical protein